MTALTVATEPMIEGVFDGAAPTYDRVGPVLFHQFGQRLQVLLAPPAGASVLDMATRTGAVLAPAAVRVGRAYGIDLFAGILADGLSKVLRLHRLPLPIPRRPHNPDTAGAPRPPLPLSAGTPRQHPRSG